MLLRNFKLHMKTPNVLHLGKSYVNLKVSRKNREEKYCLKIHKPIRESPPLWTLA